MRYGLLSLTKSTKLSSKQTRFCRASVMICRDAPVRCPPLNRLKPCFAAPRRPRVIGRMLLRSPRGGTRERPAFPFASGGMTIPLVDHSNPALANSKPGIYRQSRNWWRTEPSTCGGLRAFVSPSKTGEQRSEGQLRARPGRHPPSVNVCFYDRRSSRPSAYLGRLRPSPWGGDAQRQTRI